MIIERNITEKFQHFRDKLIFVSGPRQAGKTFIINERLNPTLSFNMDVAKDRLSFKKFPDFIIDWYKTSIGPFPEKGPCKTKPLIFLDEIHKVRGWRNLIKGTFDKTAHAINYVASGSSAFKLRKQDQGDSLAGRAIWLCLFPVSFREYVRSYSNLDLQQPWKGDFSLVEAARNNISQQEELRKLWDEYVKFGSFPENLTRKDMIFYEQWLEDYLAAMLERDLKDLHLAKDVERVYQVFQLLLEGLGATYSLRSLAETLGVSPNTIKSDIRALKQVLWGFELPVAMISKVKQIRKEKKFYPIDFCFSHYQEPLQAGSRFETIVACLLKRGLYSETSGVLNKLEFGFYRDYSKREIDFIVQRKNKILLAAECKLKSKLDFTGLKYLSKFNPKESILIVEEPSIFKTVGNISIISIELLASCFE